jgi:acyl dehydratase
MRCVVVGQVATFSKTVSESDVYLFAGISGDFYAAHVDAAAMAKTRFGERIAHGALLVGFMSAAGSRLIEQAQAEGEDSTPVSLGYDRLRFVAPVRFGDTVTTTYRIKATDVERSRSTAEVEARNQRDETVAVAEHIMKWLPAEAGR